MAPKNQRWWLTQDSVERDIEADADVPHGSVADLPRTREGSPEGDSGRREGDGPRRGRRLD